MRFLSYTTALLIVLAVAISTSADHVNLSTTGYLPIIEKVAAPTTAFALKFDLSSIPTNAVIDLAELRLTVNSDTSLGEQANVIIYAAGSEWTSSELATKVIITKPDTLFNTQMVLTGDEKWLEVDVNHIVTLWHSGELTNNGFYIEVLRNDKKYFGLDRDGIKWNAVLSVYYSK